LSESCSLKLLGLPLQEQKERRGEERRGKEKNGCPLTDMFP
jgi:hypothetical protein